VAGRLEAAGGAQSLFAKAPASVLQMVEHAGQWEAALADAFRFDTEVLMEEKIVGREATVGILDDKPAAGG